MARLAAWWHWLFAQFAAWWHWLFAQLAVWWPWMLAGVGCAAALYVVWWLWWRLPKRQVRKLNLPDDKTRADVEDNFRKTISQIFGGAAVLAGAAFAYLQFTQQKQDAHDLLISNQVAKGFELLGNKEKNLEQRLGGIYALEGVMNGSEQYHQPVLEALCAFIRDQTQTKTGDDGLAVEIQAALTVIGRRKPGPEEGGIINLPGAHIPKAVLIEADLSLADLSDANLNGANLSAADLQYASLLSTNLSGAYLLSANLSGAYLLAANLHGADLHGANLHGADLHGADLRDADLHGARDLTQDQLDGACGDENTKLDPPLTIKPCTPPQPAAGGAK